MSPSHVLQGKSNSPETRKKDLLASLCLGLQVHGINLVLDDSEDSAQLLLHLLK